MSRITQADVVRGAIEQLSKRGGYTPNSYFAPYGDQDTELYRPGEAVGATCAIGGVEQAIWRLTGEDVHGVRHLAYDLPAKAEDTTPRQRLYASVMQKLNAKARGLFPELNGRRIDTVEDVTFEGSRRTSRKRTLQVFEAVLADLEKPKATA